MRLVRKIRLTALLAFAPAVFGAAAELERCNSVLDRGDFQAAAREAQAFVKIHPSSADGHVLLARAQMGLNNASAAMRELRAALQRDPNNLDALYYLSKLADVLSRQEFMAMARMDPDSARVHQLQAEGLASAGRPEEAEREYLAALERRPETPAIMNALGDLKRMDKSFKCDEALVWYGKVLDKAPGNFDALYGSGACYLRAEELDKAQKMFSAALKSNPSSIDTRMALGETLLALGKPGDALPFLEAAAKTYSQVKRLQFLLARAYKETGRGADAKQALERYRELSQEEEESTGNPEKMP